jgi:hypothetical protein
MLPPATGPLSMPPAWSNQGGGRRVPRDSATSRINTSHDNKRRPSVASKTGRPRREQGGDWLLTTGRSFPRPRQAPGVAAVTPPFGASARCSVVAARVVASRGLGASAVNLGPRVVTRRPTTARHPAGTLAVYWLRSSRGLTTNAAVQPHSKHGRNQRPRRMTTYAQARWMQSAAGERDAANTHGVLAISTTSKQLLTL